jgi:hypothetical protein
MQPLKEPFATLRRLKGNDILLPVYAGIIAEARKSMDDWFPVAALGAFKELARSYGLAVAEDCAFEPLSAGRKMDALDRSPTTHACGLSLKDLARASPAASVHVFISRRRDWAEEALCSFSYPVAIPEDRLLVRPRIDASRVGAAFGYPGCCVESFMKWNNWRLYSHFSQAYRSAGSVDWRANCLPRNTRFMTIFHVPCEPTCAPTIAMSQRILGAVTGFDADYGRAIEESLKGVFLIVHEAAAYKLHGAVFQGDGAVAFRRAEPVVPAKLFNPPQIARISRLLETATWVEVAEGIITTRNGEERFYEVDPHADWVEDPCLVSFE